METLSEIKSILFGEEDAMEQLNDIFARIDITDNRGENDCGVTPEIANVLTQPLLMSYINTYITQEKYKLLDKIIKIFRGEESGEIDSQIEKLKKLGGFDTNPTMFWKRLQSCGGGIIRGDGDTCELKNKSYIETLNIMKELEYDENELKRITDGWTPFINYVCNTAAPHFLSKVFYRFTLTSEFTQFGEGEFSYYEIVEAYKKHCDISQLGQNQNKLVKTIVDYMKSDLIPQLTNESISVEDFYNEVLQAIWVEYKQSHKDEILKRMKSHLDSLKIKLFFDYLIGEDGWKRYLQTPQTERKDIDACIEAYIDNIDTHTFPDTVDKRFIQVGNASTYKNVLLHVSKKYDQAVNILFPASVEEEDTPMQIDDGQGMDFDTFVGGMSYNMDDETMDDETRPQKRPKLRKKETPTGDAPATCTLPAELVDTTFHLIDMSILRKVVGLFGVDATVTQQQWDCIQKLITYPDLEKNPLVLCMYFIIFKWLHSS